VDDARRDTRKAAGTGLDRPLAESERERPLEHVEHVVEFAMAVRRGTGKARREHALGQEERTRRVLAGRLDEDLCRPGIMVLALSGAVKDRIHGADHTLPRVRFRLPASARFEPAPVSLFMQLVSRRPLG
jgi:hypothetical protein